MNHSWTEAASLQPWPYSLGPVRHQIRTIYFKALTCVQGAAASQQPSTTQEADEGKSSRENEAESDDDDGSDRGKPLAEACAPELDDLAPAPLATHP